MRSSISVMRKTKIQPALPVVRKYRRLRSRCCLRMEYKNLRSLLPGPPNNSPSLKKKVDVVDAAYQYICELQTALLAKFSSKGIPADLAGVLGRNQVTSTSDIQALALHLIQNGQVGNRPQNHIEQQAPRLTQSLVATRTAAASS